ncbi:hypothetical protein [Barnesiella intestinihominis]|jgi:methyltransferase|uniref:hypothetical protein n=1 Tax=Barnesiella intestinihominis TaxID=487174 RepID=UPI0030787ECA
MNSNDRANLIKRINTLEGLTDKERSALLGLLRENKTYGLVWEDKPEYVEERLRDELPILTEVQERTIISEDKDAPNHLREIIWKPSPPWLIHMRVKLT